MFQREGYYIFSPFSFFYLGEIFDWLAIIGAGKLGKQWKLVIIGSTSGINTKADVTF